jgi:hypothetical protein
MILWHIYVVQNFNDARTAVAPTIVQEFKNFNKQTKVGSNS